jgi:uroporphyrinogen decarboxylase
MNGYERISSALKGEPTDKVPVMLHNFLMAAREHGVTMQQFRDDPKVLAGTFISAQEKYQYDGILVDVDTVTLAGAVGVPVDFPDDDAARTPGGCLETMEDVKKLKPVNIENYRYVQNWLEGTRLLKEYYGDEVFIRGNCDQDPFSLASMMRGAQNWMTDLLMADEGLIFDLLEYCTDITSQFLRLMAQTGCDMLSNGDSPAGPEMISAEMYEKYALPYEKRIADLSHELGLPYGLHICGNTDIILEKMLETGSDAFELDYKTDIRKVHDLYKDRVTLIGNIDPSGVIALGTPELVRKVTLELLELYSDTNRFILNAGCAIPAFAPAENLFAMISTAREFRP